MSLSSAAAEFLACVLWSHRREEKNSFIFFYLSFCVELFPSPSPGRSATLEITRERQLIAHAVLDVLTTVSFIQPHKGKFNGVQP
jgi:hypothetical protein